jgi:hypothetical protein
VQASKCPHAQLVTILEVCQTSLRAISKENPFLGPFTYATKLFTGEAGFALAVSRETSSGASYSSTIYDRLKELVWNTYFK